MIVTAPFDGPLFIVGMPRSGTKLLRELLNQHPCIRIPDVETEFLPWLVRRVQRQDGPMTFESFERLYASLCTRSFFTYRAEVGQVPSAAAWWGAARTHDAAGLFESLIRLDVEAPPGSGRIWGDKSPSYIDDIALIRTLYPRARVVHIVRDVRDHCLSMSAVWGKDMLRAAQRWADGVRRANEDGQALGANFLMVRYEDLLNDAEKALRRVCLLAGVEFLPSMLTLKSPAENLGAARGATAVVAGNQGKYLSAVPHQTLSLIESIASDTMLACGYRLALAARPRLRLSKTRMLLGKLFDGFALMRHRGRDRGLIDAFRFYWRHLMATSV